MSKLSADSLSSRSGGSISVVNDVNVTGIITATTFSGAFSGDGAGLTGVSGSGGGDWRDNSLF